MTRDVKQPVRSASVVEIDAAELAVRMCEASYEMTRPCPDATQALAAMDEDCRLGWIRAAMTAMEYLRECVERGQRPS